MKQGIIILLLLVLAGTIGKAQTVDEWLQQKQTQNKYLLEQIAAYKMYIGYVQKGYAIAQNGLSTISSIKKGDCNLHSDYFTSLKTVNPKIRTYATVGDIVALQLRNVQIYKDTYKQVQQSHLLSPGEVDYLFRVFTHLLSDCSTVVRTLTAVLSDDQLQMKDEERLKRIDALYDSMQDKFAFAQSFRAQTSLLILQRMKEKNEVQTNRTLYGIKNK